MHFLWEGCSYQGIFLALTKGCHSLHQYKKIVILFRELILQYKSSLSSWSTKHCVGYYFETVGLFFSMFIKFLVLPSENKNIQKRSREQEKEWSHVLILTITCTYLQILINNLGIAVETQLCTKSVVALDHWTMEYSLN